MQNSTNCVETMIHVIAVIKLPGHVTGARVPNNCNWEMCPILIGRLVTTLDLYGRRGILYKLHQNTPQFSYQERMKDKKKFLREWDSAPSSLRSHRRPDFVSKF